MIQEICFTQNHEGKWVLGNTGLMENQNEDDPFMKEQRFWEYSVGKVSCMLGNWTGDKIVIQGNTPKLLQRGKAYSRESLGKTMIHCPSYLRVRRMLWWKGESPPSISSDTESCPFFKTKLLDLLKGSPLVAFLELGRQSTSQACCLDQDHDSQGHRSTKPPSSHWQLTEQLKLHASRQNRLS